MSREKRLIATLDFETDPFSHGRVPEPFVVGIAIENGEYVKYWGEDCAEWARDFLHERKLRVYAHNGGKFDYFFMIKFLDPKLMIINGRIAKARIGESILVDSYLILPMPLKQLDKDEIDYEIMERENRELPENKKEILNYLESDCKYLLDWVLNFNDRFGVKLTVASAAFGELENTGYPCKEPSYDHYDELFRQFYFGGRTQAFKKGVFKGPYKVFDINSAYPFAMKQEHPYGTDYIKVQGSDIGTVDNLLEIDSFWFIHIKAITKGCLPYRDPDDKQASLIYPVDDIEREFYTTKWEILSAIKTDSIKITEIINVYIHSKTKCFSSYVTKFFDEKTEGKKEKNPYKTLFAKLMLNSAYGKFGADGRKYRKWLLTDEGELPFSDDELEEMAKEMKTVEDVIEEMEWKHEADTEFGKSWWSRPDPALSFYNVAVAASITGFVRAYLWEAINASKNVLYCDTDSLICTKFSGGKIDEYELGAWDIEGEAHENKVWIGGRKLYTMLLKEKDGDGNHKIKKAHKGARLTHEQIKNLVETGKEIEWKNSAPSFSISCGVRFVKRKIKLT